MYLLIINYVYKGSPVQCVRTLVESYSHARGVLADYLGDDYLVISVDLERCK